MKITFLGSSHGVPEPHRQCACAMIEISGRYYFIDMGVMAINDLVTRGIKIDDVKGIFITHMHGDHTNGLISFADLISWYFKTADPVIYLPKIEGAKVIEDWIAVTGSTKRDLHYEEVTPGLMYDDGFIKITAFPTQHCYKSYAYLVEAEGKNVLFTGDLRKPEVDFPEIIKEKSMDLVICEAAHFPAVEYFPIFKDCDIKKVCVNHHAPWNIPHIQQLAKDMDPIPVVMANDGLELTVSAANC